MTRKTSTSTPGNRPTSPLKFFKGFFRRLLTVIKTAARKVSEVLSTKIIPDEFSIVLLIWLAGFLGIEILLFLQYLSIKEVIYQAIILAR